jgi:hypothetical protein
MPSPVRVSLLIVASALVACSSSKTGGSVAAAPIDSGAEIGPVDAGNHDAGPAPVDAGLCNPVSGGCPSAATSKCAVVDGTGGPELACVPTSGSNTRGNSCSRDVADGGDPAAAYGRDNCGAGLFCTAVGVSQPAPPTISVYRCRGYCSTAKECDTGESCSTFPPNAGYGFCVPTCVPFSQDCGSGVDCSDTTTSDGATYTASCRTPGTANSGDACVSNLECAASLVCMGAKCTALCDGAHACAAGSCTALAGLASGAGYCK